MNLQLPAHIWILNHLNKALPKMAMIKSLQLGMDWEDDDKRCIPFRNGTLGGSRRDPSHIRSCWRDQLHKAMPEAHWDSNHTPFLPPQGASWRGDDLRALSWSQIVLSQGQHRQRSNLEELLGFWSDFYLLLNQQSAAKICSWTWDWKGFRAPFYCL